MPKLFSDRPTVYEMFTDVRNLVEAVILETCHHAAANAPGMLAINKLMMGALKATTKEDAVSHVQAALEVAILALTRQTRFKTVSHHLDNLLNHIKR